MNKTSIVIIILTMSGYIGALSEIINTEIPKGYEYHLSRIIFGMVVFSFGSAFILSSLIHKNKKDIDSEV